MGVVNTRFAVLMVVATAAVPATAQLYPQGGTQPAEATDAEAALAPLPRPRPKIHSLGLSTAAQVASSAPFGAAPTTSSVFPYFGLPSPDPQQPFTTTPSRSVVTSPAIPGLAPPDRGLAAFASAVAENRPDIAAMVAFPLPRRTTTSYSTVGLPFPPSVIAAAAMKARAEAETDPATVAAAPTNTSPEPVMATAVRAPSVGVSATPVSLAPPDVTPTTASLGHDTRVPQAGGGQQLHISNKTNVKIATLSIMSAKGRVRATRIAENLAPFKSTNAALPPGQGCEFTVQGAFEDGSPIATDAVDLCRDPAINITLW